MSRRMKALLLCTIAPLCLHASATRANSQYANADGWVITSSSQIKNCIATKTDHWASGGAFNWGFIFSSLQDGRGTLRIFISDPAWSIPVGEQYPVYVQVDDLYQTHTYAQNPSGSQSKDIIVIDLIEDLDQAIRSWLLGVHVKITAAKEIYTLSLHGTRVASSKMVECIEANGYSGKANPFAQPVEENPFDYKNSY